MVCLAFYKNGTNADIAKYMLNIPLVLYAIIFLIKYKFAYKVIERISVFLQDAVIITCYNIFVLKYSYITANSLDFFALAIVAALELIILLPKLVNFFKNEDE